MELAYSLPMARIQKRRPPFLTALIAKIAKRMGAQVILEPEFGYVGQIVFQNGNRTFFRNRVLSINTASAIEVSRDKNYASFFLRQFGYNVPEEQTFFSPRWSKRIQSDRDLEAAAAFAKQLGYPVVIKPNTFSQGELVTVARNERELRAAARAIFARTDILLVQAYVSGRDYRVVVLDGRVISAYERTPLEVLGDGKSTMKKLVARLQKSFEEDGRDTRIDLEDFRIPLVLRAQKLTLLSVPTQGRRVKLLDNANLSTGGTSRDLTDRIHPDYAQLAANVTRDMGLRLCGVDILASDLTKPLDPGYVILEINASPGLDHYAASGRKQKKIVEELYAAVLRALEKGVG